MTQEVLTHFFGCPCIGGLPSGITLLVLGATLGLFLGLVPGLGGMVGLAILLPLTLEAEGISAILMAAGMLATLNTSDTVPAVLFAVPGTNAAQATVLDGHAMARLGEANRALGAAYMASLVGGIFGAAVLGLALPVMQPMVLAFASPEFFMLSVLGISMVAVLSGRAPGRGLVVAFLGLALGVVGPDPQTGVMRWVGGELYFFDGVPLVPVALGLFAIPELVDLAMRGESIEADADIDADDSMLRGFRDGLKHWFLVMRGSVIGVAVGAIPGLGGSVTDWMAYAHAAQSSKNAERKFGEGEVRGVIGPESANNAREGGALIPTIAFGIPGSAAMALLLSIFVVHGITPGREMLTSGVDVTYAIIWGLAGANVIGFLFMVAIGPQIAKIAKLPARLIAPIVLGVVFMAVLQTSGQLWDLTIFMAMGVLGWLLKRNGWPRPPLLLAFILAPFVENYFFRSMSLHGAAWLGRPLVIGIGAVTIFVVVWQYFRAAGQMGD